jgi:hypothetical protein
MALWTIALLGTRPFSALLAGLLVEQFGARVAMAVTGFVIASGSPPGPGSGRAGGGPHQLPTT